MKNQNPLEFLDNTSLEKKWLDIPSELEGVDGKKKNIKIELMEDGKPRAMAFFDIDGTLAHLEIIHDKAIVELFPNEDPKELGDTYLKGFKLGNSFREFDRMLGIYSGLEKDRHKEWKDPEFYLKNRFIPNAKEIDEPGNEAHEDAAKMLEKYGEAAAKICEDLLKKEKENKEDSEVTKKPNIAPIFKLAHMYARLGIPMVGFTANAKVFVDKLAKYLRLSDIFIDIATDETMAGGGKENAIHYLINKMKEKGINVPKDRLIFVGDSLRGDIGSSLVAHDKDKEIHGQGVLVLKDKEELIQIKKEISEDPNLRDLVNKMEIHGFVEKDVPKDENGEPMLLSIYRDKFLEKL